MKEPVRLQLSRRKGFDLQAASAAINGLPAVNCARPGKWGNIFIVSPTVRAGSKSGAIYITVPTIDEAVEVYEVYLRQQPEFVEEMRRELRGSNLACWCGNGIRCHVDVMLRAANSEGPF